MYFHTLEVPRNLFKKKPVQSVLYIFFAQNNDSAEDGLKVSKK